MAKFKGYDWTELSKAFKIDIKQEDDTVFDKTIEYLTNSFASTSNDNKLEKKTAKLIREYLSVLVKFNGYNKPVWEGMLKIKLDETLIVFTIDLLHRMWT